MAMCADLSWMCENEPGPVMLRRDGQVVVSIGRHPAAVGGGDWLVIDWTQPGGAEHVELGSYGAAMAVYRVLGDDARRVIGPVVAAWRHRQTFPLGSSLSWVSSPLETWTPTRRPVRAPRRTP